jgi:hypothetical protein
LTLSIPKCDMGKGGAERMEHGAAVHYALYSKLLAPCSCSVLDYEMPLLPRG